MRSAITRLAHLTVLVFKDIQEMVCIVPVRRSHIYNLPHFDKVNFTSFVKIGIFGCSFVCLPFLPSASKSIGALVFHLKFGPILQLFTDI